MKVYSCNPVSLKKTPYTKKSDGMRWKAVTHISVYPETEGPDDARFQTYRINGWGNTQIDAMTNLVHMTQMVTQDFHEHGTASNAHLV